jgi:hypothetical protein
MHKTKILFLPVLILTTFITGCGKKELPPSANISVPYTSQAPTGNWSEPWKNACEETSIYMVSSFYADDPIKRDEAIKHIKEIIAAKNKEFQVSADESLEKISELIKLLGFPWSTEIVEDPTLEQIKEQLASNQPIIAPVFAPALHYTAGGPDYHVMVMTGYDDKTGEFIVNDPALKKGMRFKYDVFMKAIHDLDQKNYKTGKKALLFTKKDTPFDWFGLTTK